MWVNLLDNMQAKLTFVGESNSDWDDDSSEQHHKLTIRNTKTNKTCSFSYWTSRANPHPDLDSEDTIFDAVYCVISDIDMYNQSSNESDFCKEIGMTDPVEEAYDKEVPVEKTKGHEVYMGCKSEARRMYDAGFTDDDFEKFWSVANEKGF